MWRLSRHRASELPYYAARSLLRMFIALFLSVAFTFVYATAAARSRRARIVLVPVLDILQSVPVLGFLAITITFFIALFPAPCSASSARRSSPSSPRRLGT